MYASLPLSPRKARHFPPHSGEAVTKEERIIVLKVLTIKCLYKEKLTNYKLSPDDGESGGVSRRKGQVGADTKE